MFIKDKLKKCFGNDFRTAFLKTADEIFEECEEIRIRKGQKVAVICKDKENELSGGYIAEKCDIDRIIELISDYSPYSVNEEMKKGFITIDGGFRIGLCGEVVVENEKIMGLKGINSINIRICREVKGCSDAIINKICKERIKNTIIISPPACGKTTLLRDIIRNISNRKINIGVVDERFEISGMHMGKYDNDLGTHTDIYCGCLKEYGIMMLLRAMSPKVICVDEINGDDCKALEKATSSGVNIICTAHGEDISDMKNRKDICSIWHIFDLAIVLSHKNGAGTIEKIYELKEEEKC